MPWRPVPRETVSLIWCPRQVLAAMSAPGALETKAVTPYAYTSKTLFPRIIIYIAHRYYRYQNHRPVNREGSRTVVQHQHIWVYFLKTFPDTVISGAHVPRR